MPTMRAAVYEREGSAAEVLDLRDVEIPEPGPGEVRVRVVVSAINPTDVKTRAGLTPRPIRGFQVPHMDGAGVVEAVGEGVDPTRIGERVWLMTAAVDSPWGTAAQHCVVPATSAQHLPDSASFEVGAMLGVPAVTAAHCLFGDGPIADRSVLVAGGAGAVGRSAVQLAHWAGARVATTVSGPEKAAIASAAGADLVINYREPGATERIAEWCGGSVDRIVELALGPNLDLDLSVTAPGTVVVTYAIDGPDPVIPVRRCMMAGITLRFMLLYRISAAQRDEAVARVNAALADNALSAAPYQEFTLADIVRAQEVQEAGPVGRVLLRP